MAYVTRAQWGARAPSGSRNAIGPNPKGSAIHWEGPTMGAPPHSSCPGIVRGIQAFHMDTQGWSDIAYSLVVCQHGDVYEGRGAGVGSAANGSTQANADWYAICALVGTGDAQPPAMIAGIQSAADRVRSWPAGSGICGHRDLISTQCPGDALYGHVKAGTFAPGATPEPTPPQPVAREVDDMILIYGRDPYLLSGQRLCRISTADKDRAVAAGVPAFGVDSASWPNITEAFLVVGEPVDVEVVEG